MNKKSTLLSMLIALPLLLSACSGNSEPTPYITPTAPSSTALQPQDPTQPPGNAPGATLPPGNDAPFGVDTSNVEIPEEVTDIWGEEASASIATDALSFLQSTQSIEQRWLNAPSSITDDYRSVEPLITPEAWIRLTTAVESGDPDNYAASLVPGISADGTFRGVEVPVDTFPVVTTPRNVYISSIQDEAKFGDTSVRAKVTADVYLEFSPMSGGSVTTVKNSVTLYMISMGSGWVVDNWDLSTVDGDS